MRVNVGDIVVVDYRNLEDELVPGIFVVIYHESKVRRYTNTFNAIKVSTEERCFQIKLLKEYLPMLDHDSYLNCDMQFRFREDNVKSVLGRVTQYYLNKIVQQVNNYNQEVISQVKDMIDERNLFEGDLYVK